MAEQQRIQAPYGDIVFPQTPTLDNLSKQLYVQQKTRETRQQQENQALDQMLQKDFANIRSVDTPDVVNSYNRYKQLKKNLLFNKDLQRDPLKYNQAQQATNEAFAEMNKQINQSKEIKDMTKTMTTDRFKNPDAYADDYGQRASLLMNTPLSVLKSNPQYGDLTNWDNYRYQGSNTNFNDIVSKVYDKKNKIIGKEEALDKQGIQFRAPIYEYGTPPAQVFEGVVNSFDHKTERDAAYKWKQITPDVINKIEQDYNAIPQSKWERMGLPGPQKIDLRGGSDAEKFARILAMQNAINTQPRLVNYENRTSEKAKMDLQYERQLKMQAIKKADAKDLIKYKKDIDPNDTELNNTWVESYWGKRISDAKAGEPIPLDNPNNPLTKTIAYEMTTDSNVMKAMARNGQEPDRIVVTADNKIIPIFYKYGPPRDKDGRVVVGMEKETEVQTNKNGEPLIDKDYSKPMDLDQAYLTLGYRGQTKKQLSGTMGGAYGSPSPNRKYSYNGKTYTREQLNKEGYKDDEIEEFIKAGLIK